MSMSDTREHLTTLSRYRRGYSVPFNRPTYGYTVSCTCGFQARVNGVKREAERAAREHERAYAPA